MSKPIPGTHLYPLTFMGLPLIDSSTIKLPTAAPSPPSLRSVGMALTPLPVSGIPGAAASSQLPFGEIPDQGCGHLAIHRSAGAPGRKGLEAVAGSCTFSSGKSLLSLSFPFPVAFSPLRGELHTPLTAVSATKDAPSPCPRVPRAVGGSREPKFHVWTQFSTPKAQRGSGILQRAGQGQGALLAQILIRIPQTSIFTLISANPNQNLPTPGFFPFIPPNPKQAAETKHFWIERNGIFPVGRGLH